MKKDQCKEPGCPKKHYGRGWCRTHWQQAYRRGEFVPDPNWRKKPRGPRVYRGTGVSMTRNGYRRIRLGANNWALEHRLVMEQMLGRPLLDGENVHHKNGRKADNRPSNLELWVTLQPRGQRVDDLVEFANEILERYAA